MFWEYIIRNKILKTLLFYIIHLQKEVKDFDVWKTYLYAIVILQQLFLIFVVQQTKAEVGSSYVSKTDTSFQMWEEEFLV